jgi:hypothetical protein
MLRSPITNPLGVSSAAFLLSLSVRRPSRFTMSNAKPAAAGEAAPPYAPPEVPTTIELPVALRARLELLAAPLAADADQNVVSQWMEAAREVITSIQTAPTRDVEIPGLRES